MTLGKSQPQVIWDVLLANFAVWFHSLKPVYLPPLAWSQLCAHVIPFTLQYKGKQSVMGGQCCWEHVSVYPVRKALMASDTELQKVQEMSALDLMMTFSLLAPLTFPTYTHQGFPPLLICVFYGTLHLCTPESAWNPRRVRSTKF